MLNLNSDSLNIPRYKQLLRTRVNYPLSYNESCFLYQVINILSITNIRGLRLSFVGCESFLESNCPDILDLCEANLDDSIDSGNISVKGYLPSIWKDCSFCEEGASFCISRKLCGFLFMFSIGFHSVPYFFLLYWSPSFFCTVFDAISSDIEEVLSINPSANRFVFGDFNVRHKDWLTYSGGVTYSGGTGRPAEFL